MAKRYVRHKKLRFGAKLFFALLLCLLMVFLFFINNYFQRGVIKEEREKKVDIEKCITDNYNTIINDAEITSKENELVSYFKDNYSMSLYYKDINTDFNFMYNEDLSYYAASTIKMLDAIYIYDKALNGELNLEDTFIYESKHHLGASFEMQNYNYGDAVSLRNLVKYAVTVSDNTAHKMLLDYIGKSELRNYGLNLGAKLTLLGDDFGTIDVKDSMVYLDKLYEMISLDNDLAKELQDYFVYSDQNYLKINEYEALQKYGEYDAYYHSNGIVLADNPYKISILSLEGKSDFELVIKDINSKIFELHELFYSKIENLCYNK